MSPYKKVYRIGGLAVVIVAISIATTISTTAKDTSIQPSYANNDTDKATVTFAVMPTVTPTLLRVKNQDVPLTILGSKEKALGPSLIYTELTSKGIIANISDTSVSIYWLTEAPQQTLLRYGIARNNLVQQVSGLTPVYIHEAVLPKLRPNTVYYYSGHAPVIDSFTTPASIPSTALTKKISGSLKNGQGQCIVRGLFFREGSISAYTVGMTATTQWLLTIGQLRTTDLSTYFFPIAADQLELDALCISKEKVLYSGTVKTTYGAALTKPPEILLAKEN
jgi:hypothetical protein